MEDITYSTNDMSLISHLRRHNQKCAYLYFVRDRTQPIGGRIWDTCRLQQIKVDLLYFSCSRVIISRVHKNLPIPQNIIYLQYMKSHGFRIYTVQRHLENVPPDAQWSFGIYALHFILTRQELRVIRFRWAPIVYPLERYILTIEV